MKSEEKPLSYLIHKLLGILKNSKVPLSVYDIQSLFFKEGIQISLSNSDFWSKVNSHDRIVLDSNTGKYVYKSPYEKVNSDITLLALIRQYHNGLLVDDELLKSNSKMEKWIRSLLCKRAVRCLRQQQVAGRIKCKNGGTGSTGSSAGTGCSLYSQKPCESCSLLKGVILYPLNENVEIEELRLDEDIRDIWKSLISSESVSLEDIIRQTRGETGVRKLLGLENNLKGLSETESKKKKSKASSSDSFDNRKKRIRIRNSHIFSSTEELFSQPSGK
ncbi:hypothetical protein FG386_002307 [Cryptosporidium ryanae]|uniref:uncharacterized protein n=1 Tax=Cryptosporidium ryanae TaxID=515981 RepID=UPI00351A7D8C|nr:hypothetical protein FG386_002307 [Cryptosporidium ryanae]